MSDSNRGSLAPIILIVLAVVMGVGWYLWKGKQDAVEDRQSERAAEGSMRALGEVVMVDPNSEPTNPAIGANGNKAPAVSRMRSSVSADAGVTMDPAVQQTKIVQTPAGPLELTLDGRIPGMMPTPPPIKGVVVEPESEPGVRNPSPEMQQFTSAMNNLLSQSGGALVDCIERLRPTSVRSRQAVRVLTTIGGEGELGGVRLADETNDSAEIEACFRQGLGSTRFVRPPGGQEITIERVIQMGASGE